MTEFILPHIQSTIALQKIEQFNREYKIDYPHDFSRFHPSRQNEFIAGRLAAASALEKTSGQKNLLVKRNEDRSPQWPQGYVGSLSHNKTLAIAAVAKNQDLLSVGIDIETIGRVKNHLNRMIHTDRDLKEHAYHNEKELLALIFSVKESLYKALYPLVKRFFGFDDAALTAIDEHHKTFEIELLKPLSKHIKAQSFQGKYALSNDNLCTYIEIPHN